MPLNYEQQNIGHAFQLLLALLDSTMNFIWKKKF